MKDTFKKLEKKTMGANLKNRYFFASNYEGGELDTLVVLKNRILYSLKEISTYLAAELEVRKRVSNWPSQ